MSDPRLALAPHDDIISLSRVAGWPLQRCDGRETVAVVQVAVVVQFCFTDCGGAAAQRRDGRQLLVT